MRYRKLSSPDPVTGLGGGDYSFGRGQADFWIDVPDAPAQAVKTRMALWQGEWFLDISDGTPWNTKVLGKYTGSTRDMVIRARIIGAQGVSAIATYGSQVDRDTRAYSVQVTLDTVYGRIPNLNIPV